MGDRVEEQDKPDDYAEKCAECSVIAKPMAKKGLAKKVFKLCKKAASRKCLKRGVREVVKSIRKN